MAFQRKFKCWQRWPYGYKFSCIYLWYPPPWCISRSYSRFPSWRYDRVTKHEGKGRMQGQESSTKWPVVQVSIEGQVRKLLIFKGEHPFRSTDKTWLLWLTGALELLTNHKELYRKRDVFSPPTVKVTSALQKQNNVKFVRINMALDNR